MIFKWRQNGIDERVYTYDWAYFFRLNRKKNNTDWGLVIMNSRIVKDIRSYKGMTQVQFAEWLSVTDSTISLIEAGHRNVSNRLAAKLSHKFDVTDSGFISYQERLRKTQEYFNSLVEEG